MQIRAINLTFHGVGEPQRELDPREADVWVSRDHFLSLLDSVVGRDDVRITFDDGNASDIKEALPALAARNLSATFFVVAGRLAEPAFLNADDVRELVAAGMKIGSHGMHHRRWPGLGECALREELVQARAILEDVVGRAVTEAACPFGAYDRRVLRSLRDCGYERVYTSDRGTTTAEEFVQARNSVAREDEQHLLCRIASLDAGMHKTITRRAKLAVKRWR